MANPYAVNVGNPLQGIGQIAQVLGQNKQREEQQQAMAQRQAQITDVLNRGDIGEISSYMAANPDLAKGIDQAFNFKTDETRKNMADSAFRILSGEDPQEVIRDRAAFVSQMGGDPSQTLEGLDSTPEELERSAKIMLSQYGTPEQIKALQDMGVVESKKDQMTPYQKERLNLDNKSIKLREIESQLRQEDNVNRRKSLENKIKKERIQLDKLEREVAAEKKGGVAQKMLRDAGESEKKASSFARRMITSANELSQLESQIDPTSRVIGYISGGKGVTSEAANRLASPEEQAYASAASDFVTAQLRQESGAAIGEEEFERKYREFFPVPGDDEKQIELKRQRREAASQDMRNLSGGLYDALYGGEDRAQQEIQSPQQEQVVDWSNL